MVKIVLKVAKEMPVWYDLQKELSGMKILVSACLLGRNCKYSGGNNLSGAVTEFVKDKDVIEVCPEVLAGLGIPRMPMEIVDGSLINRNGENVDGAVRWKRS